MKISYIWLQEYFKEKLPSPKEIAEELTMHAFEVEGVLEVGSKYRGVVIGKVLSKEKHPNADRLNVCLVDVGAEKLGIVCGAANVDAGQTVPVAPVGTILPGDFKIEKREIRGILSNGMICSKEELGMEKDEDGIWVMDTEHSPGTPLAKALGLPVDYIFDIDILPNRAHDCLSHRGIAREIAALFGLSFKDRSVSVPEATKTNLDVKIENPELCRRYAGRIIKNIKVADSPDWLKERLLTLGQRSINNIVDATNFVMLDIGQPLHAFDLKNIEGGIVVRTARKGETLALLPETVIKGGKETREERELGLEEHNLIIADSAKPLALAGIKGGKHSGISPETADIVLESANFDPVVVRKTARGLGMLTESSKRFENEPTPEVVREAMERVIALIVEIAGTKETSVEEEVDIYPSPAERRSATVSLEKINSVLGTKLGNEDVEDVFARLNFEYEREGDTFTVKVPFERLDIALSEDLIEEVGRVIGYEGITAKLSSKPDSTPPVNKKIFYAAKIRRVLQGLGFSEVYTYAFQNSGEVELANPLASDKAFLRTDISQGIREALDFNLYYADLLGLEQIKIFEIGNVFRKEGEHASFAFGIRNAKSFSGKKKESDLAVDVLQKLQEEFGVPFIGETREGIFEADFDALVGQLSEPKGEYLFEQESAGRYRDISAYPFVLRDIALWVPEDVSADSIHEIIKKNAGDLLLNSRLFDEFKKDGKTSYAFRLVFQSHEKTLTDDEVNVVMDTITKELNSGEGWEVR